MPADAATHRAQVGDKSEWGIAEQLLARVLHVGELRLWQAADPKKRGPVPKPIQTPWDRRVVSPQMVERLKQMSQRRGERGN